MPDTLRLAGALVPPHDHPGVGLAIHESGVPVIDVASVLDFGPGFDVTEGPVGEANVALDLTEAVWTFAEGGFRFRDGSGPLLYAGASGDDLFLTGDLDVSGNAAIGGLASIAAQQGLVVQMNTGNCGVSVGRGAGALIQPVFNTVTQGYGYGVTGSIKHTGTAAGSYMLALNFSCIQDGSGSLTWMHGVYVILQGYADRGAIGLAYGFYVYPSFGGSKPTTFRGLYVAGHTGMNAVDGVRVEDFTGTTIRLLEIGPATPYLRLVGGAAPAANQTNLYLYEGSTPALRQVQWKAGNALGAGDRVLVLV
jgi:hypothetical protein